MLNDTLLEAFMNGFFGYGTWKAKYWFVGMEEGGGQTSDEVSARLRAWDRRGRPEIDDIRGFHRDTNLRDWFGSDSASQSTWKPLIRTVLTAERKDVDERSILEYQRLQFGGAEGETAVIETLPLPSPGTKVWNYGRWSNLPLLRDRKSYQSAYEKPRSDRIAELARLHDPEAIVFYGNRDDWSKRFGLQPAERYRTNVGRWRNTFMIATDHPSAHTNDARERFSAIGDYIARNTLRNQSQTS